MSNSLSLRLMWGDLIYSPKNPLTYPVRIVDAGVREGDRVVMVEVDGPDAKLNKEQVSELIIALGEWLDGPATTQ